MPPRPIDFGDLRRLSPIDAGFGLDRGKPIDRHYIEAFLARCGADVRGRVLEVAELTYTERYGGARDAARRAEPRRGAPAGDVRRGSRGRRRPAGRDVRLLHLHADAAVRLSTRTRGRDDAAHPEARRRAAAHGARHQPDQSPYGRERWGEHWRFTPQSLKRLLGSAFDDADIDVRGHGNALASIGFLHGLACEDLTAAELDHEDDRYPLLVTARAVKKT